MLTIYFSRPHVLRRLRRGDAGEHVDKFAQELQEAGYAPESIRECIRAAVHLGRWAMRNGMTLSDLDEAALAAFGRHLPACRCLGRWRGRYGRSRPDAVCEARHFVAYLRRSGVVAPEPARANRPSVLVRFAHWMRQHRGVTESTLRIYEPILFRFVEAHGDDPRRFDAVALRSFVLAQVPRGAESAKRVVTALRMFVRYLIAEDRCEAGLDTAIPTAARWRLSALPRYLPASDVERIVAACDPRTLTGARDRAIVLLLSRLGLRAGDVVTLRVGDLDWKQGHLRVAGKGRRQSQLPLPQEVGDAILHYLRHFRPSVATSHLFVRTRAPLTSLGTSGAVSRIVARAMDRASVRSRSRGAHVLRHSAATAMLRQGVSLDAIAAVLRHRSVETTLQYAKVDVASLREIAQLWPEVAPC